MSGQEITQDGDAIAARVPAVHAFQDHLVTVGKLLHQAATTDFAGDAKDEATLIAKATFTQIMDSFGKVYGALGQAVGLQGDRLDAVRRIGDQTESAATQSAGWDSGSRH
ncbi:conserved hypothetical protein [Frankia canadensis]|uniref:ESX-1 secretion-associated protein n=1 Tax=Frankia canadensis TaxID=1836972 RepID=A0A2I2KKW5_9ACTN|nr:hypothetical protein [Frankia canadensis]SNQ46310.1 conserved hypothetical protein [Frankia canadensis]SOU53600.1 conserved hypothetical protein [Frankia canadensis]